MTSVLYRLAARDFGKRLRAETEPYTYVPGKYPPFTANPLIGLSSEIIVGEGVYAGRGKDTVFLEWSVYVCGEDLYTGRVVSYSISDADIDLVLAWCTSVCRSRTFRAVARVLRVSPEHLFTWEVKGEHLEDVDGDGEKNRVYCMLLGKTADFSGAHLVDFLEMT